VERQADPVAGGDKNESVERVRAELPSQIAAYESELDATATGHKTRREMLGWQLRRAHKRLAYLEARLASILAAD